MSGDRSAIGGLLGRLTDTNDATYSYDAVGNRTTKTFLQQAHPDPVAVTASYSYDDIYQLTQAVVGGFWPRVI